MSTSTIAGSSTAGSLTAAKSSRSKSSWSALPVCAPAGSWSARTASFKAASASSTGPGSLTSTDALNPFVKREYDDTVQLRSCVAPSVRLRALSSANCAAARSVSGNVGTLRASSSETLVISAGCSAASTSGGDPPAASMAFSRWCMAALFSPCPFAQTTYVRLFARVSAT